MKLEIPKAVEKQIATVLIREYDELCKYILDNYDVLKAHDISDYLDKDLLKAGSGYQIEPKGLTLQSCQQRLEMIGKQESVKEKPKKEKNKLVM